MINKGALRVFITPFFHYLCPMTTAEWTIRRYDREDAPLWDEFVRASRNATFLFLRPYMDYHADRFTDHSLLAFHKGKLAAILPANIDGSTLRSHSGLTYGGWVLPRHGVNANDMGELMEATVLHCHSMGITALDYKPMPYIYDSLPAQEDLYWLWRMGAVMTECNISSTIDLEANPGLSQQRRRYIGRALATGAQVRTLGELESDRFHSMLTCCLNERHSVTPVHSEAELRLLMSRFPDNIRLYGSILDGEIQAGVCIFDTGRVRHMQYIATTPYARQERLLTPLLLHVIETSPEGTRYVDFGTSNEEHGRYLNSGLLRQKWEHGGSGVAYTRFTLTL